MMKTPKFWYPPHRHPTMLGRLISLSLWPLSLLWRLGAWGKKIAAKPYKAHIPVVAVGNITAGGTGKTPLVANIAIQATKAGMRPYILTRGHGGSEQGPHLVRQEDSAAQVGDEAKWLSQFGSVVVAARRGDGAKWIDDHALASRLIIMDDGLQNTSINPHLRIAVFSGSLGIGNGRIIPAGPLREPFSQGIAAVDAVVITGDDQADLHQILASAFPNKPLFSVRRHLDPDAIAQINTPVVAFAGIGNPDEFFAMLEAVGITLNSRHVFADHHPYSAAELAALKSRAAEAGATLVTTEKDLTRIDPTHQSGISAIPLVSDVDAGLLDIFMKKR